MIDGKNIKYMRTIKSMFDGDSVSVYYRNEFYRIKNTELLKLVQKAKFKKVKKRVHTYLEVIEE